MDGRPYRRNKVAFSNFISVMYCAWRDLFILVFTSHEITEVEDTGMMPARPSRFPLCWKPYG